MFKPSFNSVPKMWSQIFRVRVGTPRFRRHRRGRGRAGGEQRMRTQSGVAGRNTICTLQTPVRYVPLEPRYPHTTHGNTAPSLSYGEHTPCPSVSDEKKACRRRKKARRATGSMAPMPSQWLQRVPSPQTRADPRLHSLPGGPAP